MGLRMLKIFMAIIAFSLAGCNAQPTVDRCVLTITTSGLGTVLDSDGFAILTKSYTKGASVHLYPVPQTSIWLFAGWSGANGGEVVDDTIVMNADKNLTACFARPRYKLSLNVQGQGAIEARLVYAAKSPDITCYNGDRVLLVAHPDAGWAFDRWLGDLSGNASWLEIDMTADLTITGSFAAPMPYTAMFDGAEGPDYIMRPQGYWSITSAEGVNSAHSWTFQNSTGDARAGLQTLSSLPFDLTACTAPYLHFYYKDTLLYTCEVQVSTDGGQNWFNLKRIYDDDEDNQWHECYINLNKYINQTCVQIRFWYNISSLEAGPDSFFLDGVEICNAPIIPYTAFILDGESNNPVFAELPWQLSTDVSHSSSHSWSNSYATDIKYFNVYPISLAGSTNPRLTFWQQFTTDSNLKIWINISNDLNRWYGTSFVATSNNIGQWEQQMINLSSWSQTKPIYIMIYVTNANFGSAYTGRWYLDDMQILSD